MKRGVRRIVGVIAPTILFLSPAAAQHPDFSGTWTLDTLHSTGTDLPSASTYIIAAHGDTLVMDRRTQSAAGVENIAHVVVTTDGAPSRNEITLGGQPVALTSTASWAHDTLVINSTGVLPPGPFDQSDRWVLSADRASFSYVRVVSLAGQVMGSQTLVFDRKH